MRILEFYAVMNFSQTKITYTNTYLPNGYLYNILNYTFETFEEVKSGLNNTIIFCDLEKTSIETLKEFDDCRNLFFMFNVKDLEKAKVYRQEMNSL